MNIINWIGDFVYSAIYSLENINDEWGDIMINNSTEKIESLLNRGANINFQYNDGYTPLMLASSKNQIKIVELLLNRGADVNMQNKYGHTALMIANFNNSYKIVKLLLNRGANVNHQDNYGDTALIYSYDSCKKIELLLNNGSDPFIKNNEGKTALDLAESEEAKYLLSKYMWNRLYQTIKKLARQYSKSDNEQKLPKDIWELILLNKLNQTLNTPKYRYILCHFAQMLEIPISEINDGNLYGLISKYLAYGQYNDSKRDEFMKRRYKLTNY